MSNQSQAELSKISFHFMISFQDLVLFHLNYSYVVILLIVNKGEQDLVATNLTIKACKVNYDMMFKI